MTRKAEEGQQTKMVMVYSVDAQSLYEELSSLLLDRVLKKASVRLQPQHLSSHVKPAISRANTELFAVPQSAWDPVCRESP